VTKHPEPTTFDARIRRTLGRASRRTRHLVLSRRAQRVIAVLGMHRAGTSSLAGSLESAGLFLGDVRGRGQWNEKGNRESRFLMQLHEDVLKANGGNWHRPPASVTWRPEHKRRRDRYIRRRLGHPVWGFKDPRTLLVIDGWLEAIPDLEMVATVRHPLAVARSLQRRSGKEPLEPWLDLWLAYSQRLLQLHRAHEFPIIDFDLPDDAYQARLLTLIGELDLRVPDGDDPFFEASLRHGAAEDAPLPAEVERVYLELRRIAAAGAAAAEARM
jgi:hypothetical protein